MTSEITQEMMKNARSSGAYSDIWQTRGKCVFCDLKDKYILMEENGIVLTINLYPYIDGQLMAIPRKHVSSPKELTERQWETLRKMNYVSKKIIRKTHKHKGMWTLIREGGISADMSVSDHLHMQFIPFDSSDLCNWNYRELKYTPLENVDEYRKNARLLFKTYDKFHSKYKVGDMLPVVCDLIVINNRKVMFIERSLDSKLDPDYLTLPGGYIEDSSNSLKNELVREVKEELDIVIPEDGIALLDSRISEVSHVINQSINKDYKLTRRSRFVWNTYKLNSFADEFRCKAKDDAHEIHWLDLDEIDSSKSISSELKDIVIKTLKNESN